MDELESVMKRAKEYEELNESHTDGYGAADDIRILYKEILHLRAAPDTPAMDDRERLLSMAGSIACGLVGFVDQAYIAVNAATIAIDTMSEVDRLITIHNSSDAGKRAEDVQTVREALESMIEYAVSAVEHEKEALKHPRNQPYFDEMDRDIENARKALAALDRIVGKEK